MNSEELKTYADQTYGLGIESMSVVGESVRQELMKVLEEAGWKRTAPGGPYFTTDHKASIIQPIYGVHLYIARQASDVIRAAAGTVAKQLRAQGVPAELASALMMERAGLEKHIEIGIGHW